MGRLTDLLGGRVYVDTNVIVYAVEGLPLYAPVVQEILEHVDSGDIHVVTSMLTLAEVLVKPKKDVNVQLEKAYKNFLQPTESLTLCPISYEILEVAASFRAEESIKLPDAIHLATCRIEGCSAFLTNDLALVSQRVCKTVLLSELSGS